MGDLGGNYKSKNAIKRAVVVYAKLIIIFFVFPSIGYAAQILIDQYKQKITAQDINGADNSEVGSGFGYSFATDGQYAVIGAPGESCSAGVRCGAVYVYRKTNDVWSINQIIKPDEIDGALPVLSWGQFGSEVVISNKTLVVGSYMSGQLCIFVNDDGSWVLQQKIASPSIDHNQISIYGDVLVVSDHQSNKALIYKRSGSVWTLQQTLIPTKDNGSYDPNQSGFGISVSVFGETIAVGASVGGIYEGSEFLQIGTVFIYKYDGSEWRYSQNVFAKNKNGTSDYKVRSLFGVRVAIGANELVVGDQGSFNGFPSSTYVYQLINGGFEISSKFELAAESFSLKNSRILVGSFWGNKAELLEKKNGQWDVGATVIPYGSVSSGSFGISVGLDADNLLVGASRAQDCPNLSSISECGAVFYYNLADQNKTITVSRHGDGVVKSSPIGIDCGEVCVSEYQNNSQVTLTASPSNGYVFSNWSGDCSGTGSCVVTMNGNKNITANFKSVVIPNPIPTLSEWAKIVMVFAMLAMMGWHVRKVRR